MPETRESILSQITDWALRPLEDGQPPHNNNMYWLYGMPGLGKTAVANSLCSRLHKTGRLGGSYFCRRDDPVLKESDHILPTLIYRLACMWPPYRKLVVQQIRSDPQLNPYSSSSELLTKLLMRLERHPHRPFVLVIDAFDECASPGTREYILDILHEACIAVRWLRIVITSRPEQDISTFFLASNNYTPYISQDLANITQSKNDSELFAKSRMRSVAKHRRLPTNWPNEDMINALVTRSDGLFIFIETVYLLIKDDEDPNELLTKVLANSTGYGVSGLFKLYKNVLESKSIRNTETFRSVIGTILVVAPHRPLPEETVAKLLSIKEDYILRNWVDMFSSLLYRDASIGGGIRVRHLSIFEFLTSQDCPDHFRIDIDQANLEVACACLKAMIKELKFNICHLETSSLSNQEVDDLDGRIQKHISDSLQYACIYWANHLCYTSGHPIQGNIYPLIDAFFEGIRPLFWIEVLSVMRQVQSGISALRRVFNSTQVRIHSHTSGNLLKLWIIGISIREQRVDTRFITVFTHVPYSNPDKLAAYIHISTPVLAERIQTLERRKPSRTKSNESE
jgi:hypothetical protein